MISLEVVGRWENLMKRFVSITLAFAAFSGIVLITSVIAQTSAVVAQTQEDAASKRQAPRVTLRQPRPLAKWTECAPDDRKCEVERKLKGLVFDPREVPRKGKGF
jgi:hypothetical protein